MSLLTVAQACEIILSRAPPPVAENIDIGNAAGRILQESVVADREYPPINRATMDGIAIALGSWNAGVRRWRIEGVIPAGVAAPDLKDPAHACLKIMTGAELPAGSDGIIPFEQIQLAGNEAVARDDAVFQDRQFVHAKASDRHKGDVLLKAGHVLDAPRIAILAAVGHASVKVARLPRVAVISTGNEIAPVEQQELAPTQSRASNAVALAAALHSFGVESVDLTHLRDDLQATVTTISQLIRTNDLVLLTGGISKGEYDFVPAALKQSGVAEEFHGVAQKPGKPLWFGQGANATVFGLPGNPVSTLTVYRRYVVPFLTRMTGRTAEPVRMVQLARQIKPHASLTLFPPVRLIDSGTVDPVEYHGSGDFAALAESDGFVEIPPGSTDSTNVPFWAWL